MHETVAVLDHFAFSIFLNFFDSETLQPVHALQRNGSEFKAWQLKQEHRYLLHSHLCRNLYWVQWAGLNFGDQARIIGHASHIQDQSDAAIAQNGCACKISATAEQRPQRFDHDLLHVQDLINQQTKLNATGLKQRNVNHGVLTRELLT